MIASKAAAAQSVTYEPIDYDEFLQRIERIFSLDNDAPEIAVANAERLAPVAAAHRILTNAMSVMPVALRRKAGGERQELTARPDLDYVLHSRMNDAMSPAMGKKIMMSQAFWHGLGAAYIGRDALGRVTELIPLQTAGYQYLEDKQTGQSWYAFTVDDMVRKFQPGELLLCFFETYDGKHGRGMLDIARDTVATDRAAQKYLRKFYAGGGRLSGIIEIDTDADRTTRAKVRDAFNEYASDMDNAYKVAVLDKGMKFTSLGISQSEMQFIESRSFSVAEVARFTGIPEFMLQSGKQSYNSNEQQQLVFVTNALVPHVTMWEQEWAYKLFTDAELRDDDATRSKFYQTMVYSGIYNLDECRALEEMNPMPDGLGQNFFITKNLDTIGHIVSGEVK